MAKYILKRVLQFIPVFIGVTMILFAMKAIVPGDPIQVITGGKQVTPETELQLRIANGFIEVDDQGKPLYDENGDTIPTPIWKQYLTYMNDLLHGDLGTSYTRNMKVSDIWLGMLLQLFFGVVIKNATDGAFYLPISGAGGSNSDFQDWVHYILPAITLASVSTAYAARIMRSQLLEVMNQDYIRTAKAKGLSRRDIIWHHALKNALIPVVTYIGIDFGAMLAGAILTETVFNWPGVGYEIYRAVTARDWPIVMGGVTVIVIVVMLINLLVDISYAFLDPRIRYGAPKDEG